MINKYPYTDFHELNLDAFFKQFHDLKEYVDNYDVEVQQYVDQWLAAHPEATTTVQDGSLTEPKFSEALKLKTIKDYVTPEMFGAKGDGVTDDTDAVQNALNTEMPVYFAHKTYCISAGLTYRGNIIFGQGTIKTVAPVQYALTCLSNNITIEGCVIDCNDISSCAFYCSGSGNAIITNVEAKNTNNNSFNSAYVCCGIRLDHYIRSAIHDNYVHAINRTKVNPGIVSSVGIIVETDGITEISNNVIDGVACSAETTDCDGIYVTVDNSESVSPTNVANIHGNEITDCTGRFVKTQCLIANIYDNKCELANGTALFIKAFDYQYGGGVCNGNYVNYGAHHAKSSMFVHISYNNALDRNLVIENNAFYCTNEISSAVYIDGTEVGGNLRITDNVMKSDAVIDYMIRMSVTLVSAVKMVFSHNKITSYRIIKTDSATDLTSAFLWIEGNNSDTDTNHIFNESVSINNLVVKGNKGISETLNNVTMNFTNMKTFEVRYNGSTAISNLPSALSDATRIYMRSLGPNLMEYYEYAHGTNGIMQY